MSDKVQIKFKFKLGQKVSCYTDPIARHGIVTGRRYCESTILGDPWIEYQVHWGGEWQQDVNEFSLTNNEP